MRGLAALMAIFIALAVAACGGESESTPPVQEDVVALAASKTDDAGTYKADLSGTVEAQGQTVELSGTGEFDGKQRQGTMTMTTSVAGQEIDMDVVYAYPVMFMRFPPGLLPAIPADKPWVKIDLAELAERVGFASGQLMQSQQQADPSQGLKYLQDLTDVEAVGAEDIRGVPTTHYKGVVDLNDLSAKHPELKAAIDRLVQQTGISRIPMEVWIDDDNFVRQMKETFDTADADTTVTVQLYDFGTTVDVSPPPAEQTVDLGHLIGQS
jgi:outer membrane lipoprotein-sorting protein